MSNENKKRYILWGDIETTGVDYANDKLLEWAFVVTELDGYIVSKYTGSTLVKFTPEEVEAMFAAGDSWIQTTHTASGLFADLSEGKGAVSLAEADRKLSEWLVGLGLETKPMLGGNSIQFDRRFIERDLPVLNSLLSHQSMDCTSLLYFMKALGVKVPYAKNDNAHRADDDIMASIASYVTMRGLVVSTQEMELNVDKRYLFGGTIVRNNFDLSVPLDAHFDNIGNVIAVMTGGDE